MITATATEVQNNFGHFLQAVQSGDEIIILKNGKEVARLISHELILSIILDTFFTNDFKQQVLHYHSIVYHSIVFF